jgi:nucleoside-diphosphate-sugar epimerase
LLYGKNPKYLPIDENHPIDVADNVYSVTKKLGEDLCHIFSNTGKLHAIVVRLFNTFGPRQSNDYLIPTIISQAMTKRVIELWSEKPRRDFNYVSNTVDGILMAAEKGASGKSYNIGSGQEIGT